MTIETRLAEIRARVEAATEGPWLYADDGPRNILYHQRSQRDGSYIGSASLGCVSTSDEDAEFIAASRTDLPTLLAAVEAVLKALDNLDSKHHFHGHECLCGFASARSRSRTEHLTAEVRSAITAELAQDTTREDPS